MIDIVSMNKEGQSYLARLFTSNRMLHAVQPPPPGASDNATSLLSSLTIKTKTLPDKVAKVFLPTIYCRPGKPYGQGHDT
jgi:hypothetical protein